MAYHGKFQPRNPKKYKGNIRNIEFRSLWELAVMRWLDTNPIVKAWSSEEVIIPYVSTSQGNKKRRYFMDFWVKYEDGQEFIFEVKPKAECQPPRSQRKTRRFLEKLQTFQINVDKWKAAKSYADSRGWVFKILHEDNLKKLGIKV